MWRLLCNHSGDWRRRSAPGDYCYSFPWRIAGRPSGRHPVQTQSAYPGLLRLLQARELSDGQLRFLCLCAALLSPRPPSLLALNEPESSLHPDLIACLGQLMFRAAERTQLWITTHSRALADSIEQHSGIERVRLHMFEGETRINSSN